MKQSITLKNDIYRAAIDEMIPTAEAHANQIHGTKCPKHKAPKAWGYAWNKTYLGKMDELRLTHTQESCYNPK